MSAVGVLGEHGGASRPLWSRWSFRVVALATVCTSLKLWIAADTFGTDDVRYWTEFMRGVADHGPISIYGVKGFEAPYNHPPLIGWMLLALSKLAGLGVSFPFLIRAPACVADLFSAVLIFRLLKRRHPESTAGIASCAFAVSPLLFVISGFHGNTDPVFICLALLAGYALVVRRQGLVAGLAIGLALSVKITPVVMLPLLFVLAVRGGRRVWIGFLAGGAMVFLVLWMPAILMRGSEFTSQVLGYAGVGPRQWGLSQIARWLGVSDMTIYQGGDRLRFFAVAFAALFPAGIALIRKEEDVAIQGLPLCLFLFLSPSFGYQYLTWAVAPAFLLSPLLPAMLYSLGSGITALFVYSGWNNAPPWDWYEARSTPTPTHDLPLLTLTWVFLGLVCSSSLRLIRGHGGRRTRLSDRALAPSESREEPSHVRN